VCAPNGDSSPKSGEEVLAAFREAWSVAPDEASGNALALPELMDEKMVEDMLEKADKSLMKWAAVDKDGSDVFRMEAEGLRLRKLANGIAVNVLSSKDAKAFGESIHGRGHVRILIPGGRLAEKELGSIALGAMTLQENGSFGPWTREQVELFCIENSIEVGFATTVEFVYLDFSFTTFNDKGLVSVLQLVHNLFQGNLHWDAVAFNRAKQTFMNHYETTSTSLEDSAIEALLKYLSGGDERYATLKPKQMESLTLETVRDAFMSLLTTDSVEVSLVGDFDASLAEDLSMKYLGSIDASKRAPDLAKFSFGEPIPLAERMDHEVIRLTIPDSEARGVAYIAGTAASWSGHAWDGSAFWNSKRVADLRCAEEEQLVEQEARRNHPLFGYVGIRMITSIISRELFSTVRETKGLTYEANFNMTGFDRLWGGWFLVYVTANPSKLDEAAEACSQVLSRFFAPVSSFFGKGAPPITEAQLDHAKRSLVRSFIAELGDPYSLASHLSGIQLAACSLKPRTFLRDVPAIANAMTLEDLRLVCEKMGVTKDASVTCIAASDPSLLPAPGQASPPPVVRRSSTVAY